MQESQKESRKKSLQATLGGGVATEEGDERADEEVELKKVTVHVYTAHFSSVISLKWTLTLLMHAGRV